MEEKRINYETPSVEVLELEVERGFQGTGNGGASGDGESWNPKPM